MIQIQRIYPTLNDKYKYGVDMGEKELMNDPAAAYGIFVDGKLKKWGESRHIKGRMSDYRSHKKGVNNDYFIREKIREALSRDIPVYIELYIFSADVKIEQLEVHGKTHDVAYIDGDATSLERALRSISISEGIEEPWEKQPRGDAKYRDKRK